MFSAIVTGTPLYVWGILAALVGLGLFNLLPRRSTRAGILLPGLAMLAYSAYGAHSGFGGGATMAAWGYGLLAGSLFYRILTGPARGVTYDQTTGFFTVPGSIVPLAGFLALFGTRYAVNVVRVMDPATFAGTEFRTAVCVVLGAVSGVLVTRALNIVRVARRNGRIGEAAVA